MKKLLWLPVVILAIVAGMYAQSPDQRMQQSLQQLFTNAEKGDPAALFHLAGLYDRGFDSIARDTIKSLELYIQSADKGYAPAQNILGFRYYNGQGLTQNVDSALYWLTLAADKGDITAAANLGYLYSEGSEIIHDEAQAMHWLKIAAEGGVPGAQIKYVELARDSWNQIPADSLIVEGMILYLDRAPILGASMIEKAAQAGNIKAMALMGDAYAKGRGVHYDYDKSNRYFYQSALGGDPSAQFIIGELLEFFPDFPIDQKDPEYWYEKAKEKGVTDSESAYSLLYSLPETTPETLPETNPSQM